MDVARRPWDPGMVNGDGVSQPKYTPIMQIMNKKNLKPFLKKKEREKELSLSDRIEFVCVCVCVCVCVWLTTMYEGISDIYFPQPKKPSIAPNN